MEPLELLRQLEANRVQIEAILRQPAPLVHGPVAGLARNGQVVILCREEEGMAQALGAWASACLGPEWRGGLVIIHVMDDPRNEWARLGCKIWVKAQEPAVIRQLLREALLNLKGGN